MTKRHELPGDAWDPGHGSLIWAPHKSPSTCLTAQLHKRPYTIISVWSRFYRNFFQPESDDDPK